MPERDQADEHSDDPGAGAETDPESKAEARVPRGGFGRRRRRCRRGDPSVPDASEGELGDETSVESPGFGRRRRRRRRRCGQSGPDNADDVGDDG